MSGASYEDLSTFYCFRRHKIAIKAFLRNTEYLYTVDSNTVSTKYAERVVAFPLQQWLRERAAVLCYKYVAYHV